MKCILYLKYLRDKEATKYVGIVRSYFPIKEPAYVYF
jgi:hypothetical protein